VIEAPEVGGNLVANALIAEIGLCAVAVAVAVVVADYRDQVVVVVVEVAESGCWFERMHPSLGAAAAVALAVVVAEEADVFIQVALVESANPASHP
jgi:hypothetical protein